MKDAIKGSTKFDLLSTDFLRIKDEKDERK
jgi:hypothetical protein